MSRDKEDRVAKTLLQHIQQALDNAEHERDNTIPHKLSFTHGFYAGILDLLEDTKDIASDMPNSPVWLFDEAEAQARFYIKETKVRIADSVRVGELMDYDLGYLRGCEAVSNCINNARFAVAESYMQSYIDRGPEEDTTPEEDLESLAISCNGLNAMFGYELSLCIRQFCKYAKHYYPDVVFTPELEDRVLFLLQADEKPWARSMLRELLQAVTSTDAENLCSRLDALEQKRVEEP